MSKTIDLTTQRVEVTGAGHPEANGVYVRIEDWTKQPQWKCNESGFMLFWSGSAWIIGNKYHSGEGYWYSNFSEDLMKVADNIDDPIEFEKFEREHIPHAMKEEGWLVVITGYDPPKFVGGIEPAPTVRAL